MKANHKHREEFVENRSAFTFIVPMTMAIVIGFAMLTIGAYIVGTISSTLEDSFPATGRTDNQNATIALLGNISQGFADVVDIEIVVIIITALSMAILAIMAVGSRRALF
jgi:hypothetical protein